ncbi:MAG: gas vesicle protein [Deltaproteobacteria bacterium]|nr:gas vesicle protein [Deltaproteobacteria bacterium]
MERTQPKVIHATNTSNLADILERVLDKGIVITGDIKVKLVDIELLSIQIRLLVCSVDKAREMGIDWWLRNPDFSSTAVPVPASVKAVTEGGEREELAELKRRLVTLEQKAVVAPS